MTNRLGMNDVPYDASRLNTLTLSSAVASADVDAITALTGDITATGPGSVAATLATVNANVGTFGSATQVAQVTANAKGLITAISNVTITGASPVGAALTRGSIWRGSAANLAEAYALGAANKVLQSDGTDAIWSANTLAISGNSTINGSLVGNITGGGTLATGAFTLTVPATGTAALGAGTLTVSTTNDVTGATHTHAITSSSNPGANARLLASDASGFLQLVRLGLNTAPTTSNALEASHTYTATSGNVGSINAIVTTNPSAASTVSTRGILARVFTGTANAHGLVTGVACQIQIGSTATISSVCSGGQFYAYKTGTSGTVSDLYGGEFYVATLAGSGGAITRARGGSFGVFGSTGTVAISNAYGAYILSATVGSGSIANNYGLYIDSQTVGGTSNYAIYTNSGLVRLGDATSITLDNATTSAVDTLLTIGHNTTGTAANGFGGSIALNLESSTTADQAAAAIDWLWTDATHASRTALYRGKTTGNATNTGYYGHWNHSAVAGSAITVIPNATGDVTEIATFVYAVAEVTGTGTGGGTVTVTPGGGAVTLYSDGTDTLQLTCAADGSVTVQRSAGTDTFKVSLWGTWL